MLEVIGAIASFLAPFGITLFDGLVSGLASNRKDKKAAEEKAKKLLFAVYLQVNNNLASFKSITNTTFKKWKINDKDCKLFIAQFETKAMETLLTHITDIKKINESEAYNAMLRLVFATKEITRLSKLSNSLLANQPQCNVALRLENIKKHNLTIYRSLFKKGPKKPPKQEEKGKKR